MKKILFITCVLGTMLLGSCSKDHLDADAQQYLSETRKDELLKISSVQVKILDAEMRGFYDHIFRYMNHTARADDERGITSVFLATDMTCLDIVDGNKAWFRFDYQVENRAAVNRRTKFLWNFFFKLITKSNLMLNTYFKETENLSPEVQQIYSELHAIRGMSYYYLINLYQHTYKGNEDKPGVPLLLKPEDKGEIRTPVKEVYAQILKDLTLAVEKGKVTSDRKDLDQAVAATYLARVYAIMEDWNNVVKYADIAIANQDLTLPSSKDMGFAKIDSPGVLWGYPVNAQTTLMYASFFSVFDSTIDGYAPMSPKWIYSNLYDKISDTDARKQWFASRDPEVLKTMIKEYGGMISGGALAHVKFHSPATFDGDYVYLRMEDAYLMKIEAQIELGKNAEAKSGLTELMKYRDPKYDVSKIANLKDELRLQRRIELWGEGVAFFDMKRWKIGFDRTEAGSNHNVKLVVAPGANNPFIYKIPQPEMEQNPKFVQND